MNWRCRRIAGCCEKKSSVADTNETSTFHYTGNTMSLVAFPFYFSLFCPLTPELWEKAFAPHLFSFRPPDGIPVFVFREASVYGDDRSRQRQITVGFGTEMLSKCTNKKWVRLFYVRRNNDCISGLSQTSQKRTQSTHCEITHLRQIFSPPRR